MANKKNILVGVCAGISAYKTCELVRLLVKNGYSVKVMMTDSAAKFVTPLTFQTLSQNPVYTDMFALIEEKAAKHISLAQWADICVIAPLTANTLAKISFGLCDNLLTTVVCALPQKTKIVLAPAMNDEMWRNPIIQEHADKLKRIKRFIMMPPQTGELACGAYGQGRMPDPQDIYKKVIAAF